MAKKKGKREEGFTFPEFDKDEFRHKELRDSKVILFAVFYALVIAVISYYLVRMTSLERSVMLFGFIAPFGLIKILPFIVDTSEFERKNWFGPMFMSFLAWLGLFILFSNPPFNDIANPEFGVNEVYMEVDGQWNLTTEINSDTPFVLVVSVKDNWKIDNVVMSVNKGGSGFMTTTSMNKLGSENSFNITGDHRYYYYFEQGLDAEAYSFTFTAEDEEGNSTIRKTSISIA
ncbi:MAG: hypothetical protein BEU03_01485 [Marine Group III euryarchaeote CG-Epi6]|uniref:Uncharacterized protein n=1 Tax=Marine Group III euryarchaeote CG-Epi6 TaxID=1889000 RepID=A0A1J5T746_9ARCH|nr:MAG: hypothetical protein BEU03_01485 [Marine Group III euryarchaeote CG-Epi6]